MTRNHLLGLGLACSTLLIFYALQHAPQQGETSPSSLAQEPGASNPDRLALQKTSALDRSPRDRSEKEISTTKHAFGILSGRVSWTDGASLPDARIECWPGGNTTTSDRSGLFRLEELPEGIHTLRVVTPQGSRLEIDSVSPGQAPLDILFPRGRPVRIQLLHPDKEQIDHALLTAIDGHWTAQAQKTGVNEWTFPEIPGPSFRLQIRGPFCPLEKRIFTQPLHQIRIRPGRLYAGRLLDASTRQPIPGAELRVHNETHGSGTAQKSITDARGAFRIRGLEPGSLRVRIEASGYPLFQGQAVLGLNDVQGIEILLDSGSPIHGRILDPKGIPKGGVRILAHHPGRTTSPPIAETTSEINGTFRLGPFRSEQVVQLSLAPPLYLAQESVVSPTQTESVTLRMTSGATFSGTVRDTEGQPLAGAHILIDPMDSKTEIPLGGQISIQTDSRGHFVSPPLPDASLHLSIRATGYRITSQIIHDFSRHRSRTADLTLQPEQTLSGQILDETGQPVPGATVTGEWVPENEVDPPTSSTRSDRNGHFHLKNLGPQGVDLSVEAPGYLRLHLPEVATGRSDVQIRLPKRSVFQGAVLGPEGAIEKFTIQVLEPGETQPIHEQTFLNLDGHFLLDRVAKGVPYTLIVHAGGHRSQRLENCFASNEKTSLLSVTLDPALRFAARVFSNSKPIPGALIVRGPLPSTNPHDLNSLPKDQILGSTDPSGTFVVEGVELGDQLWILHRGSAPKSFKVTSIGLLSGATQHAGGTQHHHLGESSRPDPDHLHVQIHLDSATTPKESDPHDHDSHR
ncbi:MAG: carboxypeptidase-like regulatory domain-containing protein [Planctomycetota bacterium]|nr:carboxypeptidase-like regulatory domain-containing protein [Planctomycetota bacterium]